MDKLRKKILYISLVLVMVLSFVACEEEAEDEVELPSSQEIVDNAIMAWANVQTAQLDMHMTMDRGGLIEGSMVTDSSGTFDVYNKQMKMDMTMKRVVPEEDEVETGLAMYLVGDMMYMMMDFAEMDPVWMKSEAPEGAWQQISWTESQMELLKTAQVNVLGSEKVRDVDCYVLQLIPDLEQLWLLTVQQTKLSGQAKLPAVAEELLKEMFRTYSVKQWVAKDTYFLNKAEIDMAIEMPPEAMGLLKGELNMDISIVMFAYNYNQPVSIVLPPEAEEATEASTG